MKTNVSKLSCESISWKQAMNLAYFVIGLHIYVSFSYPSNVFSRFRFFHAPILYVVRCCCFLFIAFTWLDKSLLNTFISWKEHSIVGENEKHKRNAYLDVKVTTTFSCRLFLCTLSLLLWYCSRVTAWLWWYILV